MAQNEIVNVLTIKTEDSQKTIKGLKKEISDLKKVLDNAVIGTEDFEQANRDLKVAQNELKAAMTGQKQTVEALDGSYDALVQEMAKLKKEWRATADVVKRDDLGKQIDNINDQLKELDATIGNNQRKVGAYAEEFGKALEKNNDTVAASAESFKQALNEQDDATISTRTKLESVQKVTAGLASGYAAAQGAMALLGIENENLEKTFIKLQAAMAIAQGVGGMKDLVEGLSRGKVAFAGATNGVKMFIKGLSGVQKAIIGTGIGALVVAVGLLIANWDKISKMMENINPQKKAAKAARELNLEITKLANQSSAEKVVRVKELADAYSKLGDNLNAKKKFVSEYKDELADMGIEMNNVNDADKVFVDLTDEYIDAIMARAKADAARQTATEKYKEALNEITEAEKEVQEAKTGESGFWAGVGKAIVGAGVSEGASLEGTRAIQDGIDEGVAKRRQKRVEELKAQAEADMQKLFEFANEQDKIANELLTTKKSGGSDKTGGGSGKTGGGSGKSGKSDAQIAAEELQAEYNTLFDSLQTFKLSDVDKAQTELQIQYDKDKKLLEKTLKEKLITQEEFNDDMRLLNEKLGIDIANVLDEASKKQADKIKANYDKAVSESEKRLNTKLTNIDAGAETQTYLNERQKPSGNGEINAIDNELSKLETLKNITSETLNLKIAAIDAEMALFEQSSERWKELENQKIALREQTNRTLGELSEQYAEQEKARNRAIAGSITNTFTTALSSASQIIGALQEGIDTTTKEGFERNKKMQIANATIQMLVGITSALAGAFTTKSGPWDIALAAIQAATIATTGGIQIANIKKQTFDGSGSSSTPSVTPTMGLSDNLPVSYTRNLMGDMETDTMNAAQRVYILESDIDESLRKVEVRDNNTNF